MFNFGCQKLLLQFYVIGNPSDVLGARTIAPRGGVMAGGAERAVSSSSERRRATHNEVSFDNELKMHFLDS